MPDGSVRVVYAALAGNILVAVSKYAAAALSGSSAMLTEAIHSTADSANQILLLIGNRRSKAPADQTHNFGYGAEIYFWTSIVAVLVLLVGGVLSLAQGLQQIRSPRLIESLSVTVGVLALSALIEGGSFLVGQREVRKVVRRHRPTGKAIGFWEFIKQSKDPNLYESQLEDGAALVGIGIALAGILANALLGWLWADGAASCAIGVLLIANALIILSATRSLVAGEPVAAIIRTKLLGELAGQSPRVTKVETLHLGPKSILVALTFADRTAAIADPDLDKLVHRIRTVDDRIKHVLFRS